MDILTDTAIHKKKKINFRAQSEFLRRPNIIRENPCIIANFFTMTHSYSFAVVQNPLLLMQDRHCINATSWNDKIASAYHNPIERANNVKSNKKLGILIIAWTNHHYRETERDKERERDRGRESEREREERHRHAMHITLCRIETLLKN